MHRNSSRIGGLVLATGLAFVIAACSGSSTTPAPAGSGTSPAPATGTPVPGQTSAAPVTIPTLPGGLGSFAIPSFAIPSFSIPPLNLGSLGLAIHADPALEARLPSQVCGANALKLSIASGSLGAGAAALGSSLGGLLSGLGTATSFSLAAATSDPTSGASCGTTFLALKVNGGDASTVLAALVQSTTQHGGTTGQASLGGKNVTELSDSGGGAKTYVYADGDTLFGVEAVDDATAGQALAQLP